MSLNPLNLRNNLIMATVKLGYTTGDGKIHDKHLAFYKPRSRHVGALTPEPLYLDKGLRELPTQLGVDSDDKIPGLKKLTDLIHSNGAKAIANLSHPGRMANPKIPGNYHISSSAKACENGGATPKKMEAEDFKQVLDLFSSAARRCKEAGFDIIELQLGHGYLAAQFLSPSVNDRDDEYGGSFENRIKFPLEILDAVKSATDLPVIARISGDEMIPDGFHPEEMIRFAGILKERGVSAIHVTAGTVCSTPPWFFQHMFIPKGKTWELGGKIKSAVDIPVIFVGKIHSKQDIEKLQNEYQADYVAFGRALVADPDFAGKVLNHVPGLIRPCMACAEGCLGGVRAGKGLGCVVNPLAGHEEEEIHSASKIKNIAIVGGGLAGMQAALTLTQRGHKVTMYEKEELGGQYNLAHLPPLKDSLREIVDYYKQEISDNHISVNYKEAGEEDLLSGKYNEVVLASGAVPAIPPIKGLKKYFWTEFLHDQHLPVGKKVLIIGGGLIGIELASKLTDKENEVIIVEMLEEVARGMEAIEKAMTLKKLQSKQVKIFKNTRVAEILNGDTAVLLGPDQTFEIKDIDHFVMATGMRAYHPLSEKLEGEIPYHLVGDAIKPDKAQTAIRSAFELANRI